MNHRFPSNPFSRPFQQPGEAHTERNHPLIIDFISISIYAYSVRAFHPVRIPKQIRRQSRANTKFPNIEKNCNDSQWSHLNTKVQLSAALSQSRCSMGSHQIGQEKIYEYNNEMVPFACTPSGRIWNGKSEENHPVTQNRNIVLPAIAILFTLSRFCVCIWLYGTYFVCNRCQKLIFRIKEKRFQLRFFFIKKNTDAV